MLQKYFIQQSKMAIEYSLFIDGEFERKQKNQFIIILLKDFRDKTYDEIDIQDDKYPRNISKELNSYPMVFMINFSS